MTLIADNLILWGSVWLCTEVKEGGYVYRVLFMQECLNCKNGEYYFWYLINVFIYLFNLLNRKRLKQLGLTQFKTVFFFSRKYNSIIDTQAKQTYRHIKNKTEQSHRHIQYKEKHHEKKL